MFCPAKCSFYNIISIGLYLFSLRIFSLAQDFSFGSGSLLTTNSNKNQSFTFNGGGNKDFGVKFSNLPSFSDFEWKQINSSKGSSETETTTSNKNCVKSLTVINGILSPCKNELIFHSDFKDGIHQNWTSAVQFSNDEEEEFTVFDDDQGVIYTDSTSLVIKPMLLDKKYNEGFSTQGPLNLGSRCTSPENDCQRSVTGTVIIPPILSGRITTERSFSFVYGTIEIKAKLPHGDWVVPEIWLLPKHGRRKSAKIVMGKSLGNDDLKANGIGLGNTNIENNLLTLFGKNETYHGFSKTPGTFYDKFHVYKMVWDPDQITFYMDDKKFGEWNSKTNEPFLSNFKEKIEPFNQEFYLVLGVHVGGIYDFPDGSINRGIEKRWKNFQVSRMKYFYDDAKNWMKTWSDKTTLKIEYVKVWAM